MHNCEVGQVTPFNALLITIRSEMRCDVRVAYVFPYNKDVARPIHKTVNGIKRVYYPMLSFSENP